jgi:hypothetical protein
MRTRSTLALLAGFALVGAVCDREAMAQRGGGGGARSAGHRSPGAAAQPNRSPSMSRPGGGGANIQRPAAAPGGVQRPGGAPAGGIQRPNAAPGGAVQRPAGAPGGVQRPAGAPGGAQRPGGESGIQRPGATPGGAQRLGGGAAGNRPGASSDQLSDFLGMQGPGAAGPGARPGERPNIGNRPDVANRPNVGDRNIGDRTNVAGNRPNVGDRNLSNRNTTNINVGDVNVGNRVNYADNRQAWVSQRNNWGNSVRGGVGNRYNNVFNDSWYRRPYSGVGYNYWGGWAGRGPYYAWTPVAWAGVGAFFGGAWASAQPVYYGYGAGGNVYHENNVVYVNGQAAGSPEQYYQQTQAVAAAAPPANPTNAQEEWLPLGVYAVTSEDTPDASAVLQLAVNKQGVLAGTYHNEDTQVDRPVQGMVDAKTQRAVLTFGDGKNTDTVLETGVYNLTQDEAPALLHFSAEQSQPILLVRLKPPAQNAPSQ